jgi:hypothetical protein
MKKQLHKKTSLNKIRLTLGLLFCLIGALNAQDKIILTNGEEVMAKVTEVTDSEIKYKRADNLNGPNMVVYKSRVILINYANGSQDVFSDFKNNKPEITDDIYKATNSGVIKTQSWTPAVDDFVPQTTKKFDGPRIGFTFLTTGTNSDYVTDRGKKPLLTQFGWQFEQRIFTIDNGTSGIVEFVPLIAGMEQGLFLPSANLLIGLRSGGKKSLEFALGPNLSAAGLGVVFAAGTSFHSGGINFPVNIAVVPSVGSKKDVYDSVTGKTSSVQVETGWRITLTVGFNSRKK